MVQTERKAAPLSAKAFCASGFQKKSDRASWQGVLWVRNGILSDTISRPTLLAQTRHKLCLTTAPGESLRFQQQSWMTKAMPSRLTSILP